MDSESDKTGKKGWMDSYKRLLQYYEKHKHCNVTTKEDRGLGRWVARQRGERNHFLSAERRKLLDDIGFEWNIQQTTNQDVAWEVQCLRLEKYLRAGKPNTVSKISEHNKTLGTWAANQRKRYQRGMLRVDRKQRLEEIGFDFGSQAKQRPQNLSKSQVEKWEAMFQRLLDFKKEHGHTCVPYRYGKDPMLALWASTQRREKNKKSWCGTNRSIRADREERLNQIGFVWNNLKTKINKNKTKANQHQQLQQKEKVETPQASEQPEVGKQKQKPRQSVAPQKQMPEMKLETDEAMNGVYEV